MSDYIKREDVIRLCTEGEIVGNVYDMKTCRYLYADEIVNDVPSADVVEVVRCKNCRYYKADGELFYCDYWMHYVNWDGFCNGGERKEK